MRFARRPTPQQPRPRPPTINYQTSLELGDGRYSKKDLWPEPWPQAHKSDPRENAWHKKVCNGTLRLKQARAQELGYKRVHG